LVLLRTRSLLPPVVVLCNESGGVLGAARSGDKLVGELAWPCAGGLGAGGGLCCGGLDGVTSAALGPGFLRGLLRAIRRAVRV